MKPNLKAYCSSYKCTGKNDHEARPHDYKLIENISIHKSFCPNCSRALLWSNDIRGEKQKAHQVKYKRRLAQ